jgi:two-component system, NtrC family, nitrogen regulation sensor histidine kinase GlnL
MAALRRSASSARPARRARTRGTSDEFFRHMVANMRNGVLAIDRTGHLVLINDEACRAFGLPADHDYLGQRYGDVLRQHPDIVRVLGGAFEVAALPNRAEIRLKPTGKVIGYTLSLVRDDQDQAIGAALFFKDLTHVEQLVERERLRDRLAALGEMAAAMAHEIKNPLAGISGAAQLLEMTLGDAERELTTLIRDETKRVEKLLERVEAFGDTRPRPKEPVNIHDVLDRAKRAAEAGFASHVRFFVDYDPSLPPVPGDADQLMQVFQNLLKNAAEATPKVGGVVMLRTAYSPGMAIQHGGKREQAPLLVTIQDNGSGVPPEIKRDIFEPFVTSKATGSGLGLSLVSKVMTEHGGVIECDSEPGWTVMRLRFPIWRPRRARKEESDR